MSDANPEFLAHFKKAAALYQEGRVDDAVREFREAIRIDPGVAEARCNLGVALAKLGKDDEALSELEAALRIDPKHAASWYNLGILSSILPGSRWGSSATLSATP